MSDMGFSENRVHAYRKTALEHDNQASDLGNCMSDKNHMLI